MMMMMMTAPLRICVFIITASLLKTFLLAQSTEEQCSNKFTKGKEEFIIDTDESVKDGAQFLSSPTVTGVQECVSACCQEPACNLAFMENGDQQGTINYCFLFNCVYKQKKVCSFVRKKGYSNYLLTSVFGSYLDEYKPEKKDHPPKAVAGQDRVVQPHDTVVLNGIASTDDHQIDVYEWVQVSGTTTAVIEKTSFKDEVMVSKLSAGMYKFRLTVTDNAGQSDSAVITVLVLTPEQSLHHCLVPKKVGPCRGSFPRFHYNALTEQCENFTFGGCRPNRNNYLSHDECSKACDKVSVKSFPSSGRHGPIDLPNEVCGVPCGPEKFNCTNGCCIDNELVCDQQNQCSDGSDEAQCANIDSKFRRLLDINDIKEPEVVAAKHCTQPPVTGTCTDINTKWYYNPYEKKCFRFNFGGCNGNENRFDSEESCMTLCSKVTEKDAFPSQGNYEMRTEDSKSVYIAIAVALGLAILILLAVIGYCFLKEKKQQRPRHHHVSSNGAHLLPIEDTEKLVYNSTTKPI